MLKRSFFIPILSGIILFAPGWLFHLQAQEKLIKEGDLFPKIAMETPTNAKDRAYLGISGGNFFSIKDIKAKVILVEIMNVYCASCQNMAPIYNKLFTLIESKADIKKQIKMIGIGAGDNDEEIKTFRDHFRVPFPIVPDAQYAMHKAIGGSPTPFSILVRRGPKGKTVVVASTHLGFNKHYKELFSELKMLMAANPETIREKGAKIETKVLLAKPILNEEELKGRIETAFTEAGGILTGFEKVHISKEKVIYTGLVENDGQATRLFAEVVSLLPTCDVCHDVHFIYTFESSGKILQFIPLQLTKYGNENWNEADIAKMRSKIVGRYIYSPFSFNAKVDAVTSATITSAAIYRGLNEGQVIFKELKEKGLI